MSKKVLILTAIVLAFSASNLQAVEIIDSNWVGGESGSWGDPNNWDPNIVPDNNDSQKFFVTIDSNYAGVDRVEAGLQQDRTINRLDCYGKVDLEKWTHDEVELTLVETNGLINYGELNITEIDIIGNVTNHGDLQIDDLNITGNVTNYGKLKTSWDWMEINGELLNLGEGTISIRGTADISNLDNAGLIMVSLNDALWVDQTLHNAGEISLFGGECGVGEILDNNSTGVIQGFGLVYTGGFIYPEPLIQNKGKIYAHAGSLILANLHGPIINSGLLANNPVSSLQISLSSLLPEEMGMDMMNNLGTIEVNAGGGVVFDCNLVNESGAEIKLLGGTLAATTITQSAGATFEGFGGIIGNVIIEPNSINEPNSIIKLTGPTNIVGDVTIDPNATLEISDGTTLITGDCTCDNGTIHMIGGRIIIQGDFTNNNCNIIWEPGTYTNVADFNLDGRTNFKDFAYFADTWLWKASWY